MLLATPTSTIAAVTTVPTGTTPSASFFSQFVDQTPNSPSGYPGTFGSNSGIIVGAGTNVVVQPPGGASNSGGSGGSGSTRLVQFFSIVNIDGVSSITVTVNLVGPNGTQILKNAVTLLPSETLQFGSTVGFQILDSSGFIKLISGESTIQTKILLALLNNEKMTEDDVAALRAGN